MSLHDRYDNDGKLDIYSTNIRSEAWYAEMPTVSGT
jgi:hypothetical protein